MLLVTYYDNWADEMDVKGSVVYKDKKEFEQDVVDFFVENFNDDSYKTFEDVLNSDEGPSVGVGSNEVIDYDTPQAFLSSFSFKEISEAEAKAFDKLFDGVEGFWPL